MAAIMSSRMSVPSGSCFRPVKALPVQSFRHVRALQIRPEVQRCQRQAVITFAKGGGGKGKGASSSGPVSAGGEDSMAISKATQTDTDDRMKKCVTAVADNMNTVRTGRASPAILDKIMVESFGSFVPLKQVANISVPEATTLMIAPFDPASLKEIERAINASDLGLNPNNDGEKIRLGLPSLTEDRRKEMTKKIGKMGEDGKIAIRNIRQDSLKKTAKVELPKDAKKALEDAIQKLTDANVKKVDDMVKSKSDDLMKM